MKYFEHECGQDGTIRDDSGRLFCLSCGLAQDELPDDGSMARTLALVRLILLEQGSSRDTAESSVLRFIQKVEEQAINRVISRIMGKLKERYPTASRVLDQA